MIIGIHHIGISVPDMDKALAFYCGVLGMKDHWGGDLDGTDAVSDRVIGLDGVKARMRMIGIGPSYIELWQFEEPKPAAQKPNYPPSDHGLAHFSLQVRDIDAEYERLKENGMTFHTEPVHFGTMSSIYGRDPFGNIIELYEVHDPDVPQLPQQT